MPRFPEHATETTMTDRLLSLLKDGPGTSGELAIELDVSPRSCSANLHRLWSEGRIDREAAPIKKSGRGVAGYLYCLLGMLTDPAPRPAPRAKRVRVYAKRFRKEKYRDRREYCRLWRAARR